MVAVCHHAQPGQLDGLWISRKLRRWIRERSNGPCRKKTCACLPQYSRSSLASSQVYAASQLFRTPSRALTPNSCLLKQPAPSDLPAPPIGLSGPPFATDSSTPTQSFQAVLSRCCPALTHLRPCREWMLLPAQWSCPLPCSRSPKVSLSGHFFMLTTYAFPAWLPTTAGDAAQADVGCVVSCDDDSEHELVVVVLGSASRVEVRSGSVAFGRASRRGGRGLVELTMRPPPLCMKTSAARQSSVLVKLPSVKTIYGTYLPFINMSKGAAITKR